MRVAYFDCFSGASGDMILGALISAGLEQETLRKDLAGLNVPGYAITADPVRKGGFAAMQFDVQIDPATEKPHRHLKHIRQIIESASLSDSVRERALAIFTRLAEAEAAVHGTTIEKVHFHEVGAIDAIVDIVGACIGLERMGIERVHCSPIPTGSGTVHCDHGLMPVPTPATAALLASACVPLADCDEIGELTTPTGAAILTTIAAEYGPVPGMRLERVGIGSGKREGQNRPNILRVMIGELTDAGGEEFDQIAVLEANLDDMTGEAIGYVQERLFEAGALDVFTTPIYMKKNRPAVQLTVLAPLHLREVLEKLLLAETTTLGVRGHVAGRRKLARTIETVETEFGPIRIKVGRGGTVLKASPEYDDCSAAARRAGQSLATVVAAAVKSWEQKTRQAKGL